MLSKSVAAGMSLKAPQKPKLRIGSEFLSSEQVGAASSPVHQIFTYLVLEDDRGIADPEVIRRTLVTMTDDFLLSFDFFMHLEDLITLEWANQKKKGKSTKSAPILAYNAQWPVHLRSALWPTVSDPKGEFVIDDVEAFLFEHPGTDIPEKMGQSWLNEQCVGAYLVVVSHTIPVSRRRSHVFFHPAIVDLYMKKVKPIWRKLIPAKPREPRLFYWLPVCRSHHWSLYVYCADWEVCRTLGAPHPTLLHFDSLRNWHAAEISREICELIKDVHQIWDTPAPEWVDIQPVEKRCPEQENGSDCGVYTLLYARCFIRDFVLNDLQIRPVQVTPDWFGKVDVANCRCTFSMMLGKLHEAVIQAKKPPKTI